MSDQKFWLILLDVLSKQRHSVGVSKAQRNGLLWAEDLSRITQKQGSCKQKSTDLQKSHVGGIFNAGVKGTSWTINKALKHPCVSGLSYYTSFLFFRSKCLLQIDGMGNGHTSSGTPKSCLPEFSNHKKNLDIHVRLIAGMLFLNTTYYDFWGFFCLVSAWGKKSE